MTSLGLNLSGTGDDQTLGFSYNPASQIAGTTRSNDGYAWTGAANVTRAYTSNGLNQFTASGATSLGYDTRGNLTTSGSDTYTYSSENLLLTAPGSAALTYDPLLRLYQTAANGFTTTRFAYDGQAVIAEYNSSNALQKRYVFGPGSDEPLVEYDASGTKTYLTADERGSIVVRTNASGVATARNSYDEYGIPGSGNAGRFGYTGQAWLPELGMQYSKARIYSPTLGRFMQTDPIGYGDGMNWYNYVGSDPVNRSDPSGLGDVLVIGSRCPPGATCITDKDDIGRFLSNVAVSDGNGGSTGPDVVVTATRNQTTAPTIGPAPGRKPPCPRSAKYPVPNGYHAYDPQGMEMVKDGDNSETVLDNPNFARARAAFRHNTAGVTHDLLTIILSSIPIVGEYMLGEQAAVRGGDVVVAVGEVSKSANDAEGQMDSTPCQ